MKLIALSLLWPAAVFGGLMTLPPLPPVKQGPIGGYPVMDVGANYKLGFIQESADATAKATRELIAQVGNFSITPSAPQFAPLTPPPSIGEAAESTHVLDALERSPDGVRAPIRSSFQLGQGGGYVVRNQESYAPYAAVLAAYDAYQKAVLEVNSRRTQLEREQAGLLEKFRAATTQAETEKLSGLLAAVSLRVATVDAHERRAFEQFKAASEAAQIADRMDGIAVSEELRAKVNGVIHSLTAP